MNKLLSGTPFENLDALGAGLLTPRLDAFPDTVQPLFELGTRLQSELTTLMSQRAQACMEWPSQLVACRSATDLVRAQLDFMSAMQRDYTDCMEAIMSDALVAREVLDEEADEAEAKAEAAPLQAA